jgi:hypothetical protein
MQIAYKSKTASEMIIGSGFFNLVVTLHEPSTNPAKWQAFSVEQSGKISQLEMQNDNLAKPQGDPQG